MLSDSLKHAFFIIGKIEKTDWNIKEIEKKIEENKYGRGVQSSAAKVPKWNRQQFDDKVINLFSS